jgi:hypothetical protein
MAVSAAVLLTQSAAGSHDFHRWEFLGLLVAGAVSSRLKVKLPGINGNMSVNLPFIFIAMTQLTTLEALIVAGVSVFVQSIPKAPHKFVPVQALFNTSTAIVAAALGANTFRFVSTATLNPALSLVLACSMHLLASTVPVSGIISLTDHRSAFHTWSGIVQLSFPYYLASAGLASIEAGLGGHTSWPTLVGIAFVMFVTYRSYRMYFSAMRAQQATADPVRPAAASAKSAAAAQ